MKLTQSQFELELNSPASRTFNLVLLGMSQIGKTDWSKLLAQRYEYPHIEFDKLIGTSTQLTDLIKNIPGRDTAEKMGNYFGMPWSDGFKEKEAGYLDVERRLMAKKYNIGTILDLTGSAIYHPDEMEGIRAIGLVIYLKASPKRRQEMFQLYIKHPKPVCWKGAFERRGDETNEQALARCYPILLASRAKLYETFADIVLPYQVHTKLRNGNNLDGFVQEIKNRLPIH